MPTITASNGKFPDSLLVYLGWPEVDHLRLVPAAAASINRLAAAFEAEFDKPLYLSDAYRTYAQQVALKKIKGVFAATPGKSNHGLGLAIDAASRINVDGSAEHRWMEANAPAYGWINPAWAQDYNSNNGQHEPWHWEYHFDLDIKSKIPAPSTSTPSTQENDMLSLILWCYAELVGRINPPSTTEIENWISGTPGWTSAQVLDAFLNARAEPGSVDKAYHYFLGRGPESQAVIDTRTAAKLTIRQVRIDVANSPEARR